MRLAKLSSNCGIYVSVGPGGVTASKSGSWGSGTYNNSMPTLSCPRDHCSAILATETTAGMVGQGYTSIMNSWHHALCGQ